MGVRTTAVKARMEASGHFPFGANWRRFLRALDDRRIDAAQQSLRGVLGEETLGGRSFLDVGSGSGLFSLAAVKLGAERVHSFDFDEESVACGRELKRRYSPDAEHWSIELGSALDRYYLSRLGQWDVVYSWGVLHHTGKMWQALGNVTDLVAPRGALVIAIYNDQGLRSKVWGRVKAFYNRGFVARWLVSGAFVPLLFAGALASDLGHARNPLRRYGDSGRGMSPLRDWIDWVGGYPFEVATPDEVFRFFHKRGFELEHLRTVGGRSGCNEFTLRRP